MKSLPWRFSTCQRRWPRDSSRLHCSPCNQSTARCRRAPDSRKNIKSTFENHGKNTWGAIFGFLWRGSLWRRGLNRRRWWSLLLLGCKMSTLISFIQWWSLKITWRESSLRLSGAVCPSWRRPWPWCCRRQWRRRWCRRRWPAQPCSAYFGNCPANKEIWWCGQKSKHRIIVIFTPMLQFPIPYLGFDYDKVSASGAFLVPKTDYYVYLCYTMQCTLWCHWPST